MKSGNEAEDPMVEDEIQADRVENCEKFVCHSRIGFVISLVTLIMRMPPVMLNIIFYLSPDQFSKAFYNLFFGGGSQ
jgi:hypothetical protein